MAMLMCNFFVLLLQNNANEIYQQLIRANQQQNNACASYCVMMFCSTREKDNVGQQHFIVVTLSVHFHMWFDRNGNKSNTNAQMWPISASDMQLIPKFEWFILGINLLSCMEVYWEKEWQKSSLLLTETFEYGVLGLIGCICMHMMNTTSLHVLLKMCRLLLISVDIFRRFRNCLQRAIFTVYCWELLQPANVAGESLSQSMIWLMNTYFIPSMNKQQLFHAMLLYLDSGFIFYRSHNHLGMSYKLGNKVKVRKKCLTSVTILSVFCE